MKNLLIGLVMMLAVAAQAQITVPNFRANPGDPSRTELRKLKGIQNNVQEEFIRATVPITVLNSLAYTVTNFTDGIILVRTNSTVLVHIALPNPTNTTGRRFEIHTLGASTAILTNTTFAGTYTEMFTMATAATYAIASNKTAVVYSTGSNYVCRTF